MKLDFSQFHDLMHPPFTRECRDLHPNGWRAGFHHLRLEWQCRRRDQIMAPVYRHLLCPLGRHDVRVSYSGSKRDGTLTVSPRCEFCLHTRPPSEHELNNIPAFLAED